MSLTNDELYALPRNEQKEYLQESVRTGLSGPKVGDVQDRARGGTDKYDWRKYGPKTLAGNGPVVR